jgi:dTDP-4-dehydrorhamnose reductase
MEPSIEPTTIPGLLVLRLPVHADSRGWFKENWHRVKFTTLGVPDFGPVQNNVSFNARRGTTRGIHAEPWDKLVSVTTGRVFGAWVDLREGPSFGTTFHTEIDAGVAVFVPRGVGNSYQTLEDETSYSYLVNEHWTPGVAYPALDLADETAAIPWPIPLEIAEMSHKDRANAKLTDLDPVAGPRTLVLGGCGQLGRALADAFDADVVGSDELDIADPGALDEWSWSDYDVVLNAAAFTAVDHAETPAGRVTAWAVNAQAPARLAQLALRHRFTLVHYSTDYVFDGTAEIHTEDEPLSPLGVYGQSKAAGDSAVGTIHAHYLLRTSWVIGDGPNFVRTMESLALNGVSPAVVNDQIGRLTFAAELARATRHLLDARAPYGTYNVTNAGPSQSWADVAREVFRLLGREVTDVRTISSAEYARGKELAPRPRHSTLDLSKMVATGFTPRDAGEMLSDYVRGA